MIKLRLDVDYAYPSRLKSFIYTALNSKKKRQGYLKNSKIIAKMINESPLNVKAYWFFTPYTIPDEELLELLKSEKHEVGLHVANNPEAELLLLEKRTSRKINYYTIHGTARLLAQLIWGRKLGQAKIPIPQCFSLKSFHVYPAISLDAFCYDSSIEQAIKKAQEQIEQDVVLHVHPEWLFQRGTINHRGPYYEVLKRILQVDKELNFFSVRKKSFFKLARQKEIQEYSEDFTPTDDFISKIRDRNVDVLTFIDRKWCSQSTLNPSKNWLKTTDNIALIEITNFDDWWRKIGKKTRNMIRKSEKNGIKTQVVDPDDKLAEGIWRIYNETPIRQERAFPHYGVSLEDVKTDVLSAQGFTFIGAYLQDELVGFVQLYNGNQIVIISQILSLQKYFDRAINNALVAKVIEVCAVKQAKWVMYGRMGNHPSLDKFKQSNGFAKFTFTRYFFPLSRKGKIAVRLGVHREIKDSLPQSVKNFLFPFYNWVSRTKMRFR